MSMLKIKFPFQRRVRLAQGLWLLSWAAMFSGLVVFSMGVFLKTELLRRSENSSVKSPSCVMSLALGVSFLLNTLLLKKAHFLFGLAYTQVMHNDDIHVVPNLLIIVGLASVGINICAGRICQESMDVARFARWKNIFTPFFIGSFLFTCMLVVAMALSYALQPSLEESLKIGLKNGIRFYKDTDTPGRCFQKQTIDRLQMDFKCCGNTNYRDWFEVQWINNRYLDFTTREVRDRVRSNVDGRFLMDGVPFSCCNPASPRPCIQEQLLDNAAHHNYDHYTEELNLYDRGCRQALVSYYMGLMNTIGPGVVSVFVVQMSVLASLRYLQTAMIGVEAENMEVETEGYILEKGLKETVKELKENLKKLVHLSTGQVVDEATEATEGNAEAGDTEKAASS